MTVESVKVVLCGLRVKSGLIGTSKPLVGQYQIRFGYDRGSGQFFLTLVHYGKNKEKSVYLLPEDVESRSRSQWMTEKTFRMTEPAIERFAEDLVSAIQKYDAKIARAATSKVET